MLERSAEMLRQIVPVTMAQFKLCSVLEENFVVAPKSLLQLAHKVQIDDCRAPDASELVRIELLFEIADGLTKKILFLRRMQHHVIAFSLNPRDFICLEKKDAPAQLDNEALDELFAGIAFGQ